MSSEHRDPSAAAMEGILAYLRTHPFAADTVDGIARWWLAETAPHRSLPMIQEVLDQLVRDGRVVRSVLVDGTVLYLSGKTDQLNRSVTDEIVPGASREPRND